jgi:hypothetical protein
MSFVPFDRSCDQPSHDFNFGALFGKYELDMNMSWATLVSYIQIII